MPFVTFTTLLVCISNTITYSSPFTTITYFFSISFSYKSIIPLIYFFFLTKLEHCYNSFLVLSYYKTDTLPYDLSATYQHVTYLLSNLYCHPVLFKYPSLPYSSSISFQPSTILHWTTNHYIDILLQDNSTR